MSKIGVFFGTGFEEIEALTVVDLLRRAEIETVCVSIDNTRTVVGSHEIEVTMDQGIKELDFDSLDMIVCPGGMPGTKNLENCTLLSEQIQQFYKQEKWISAICAAPSIFGHLGLLKNRKACIFPGMESELIGADVVFDDVVEDGKVITSRGMGTAIPFGLAIVAKIKGKELADQLGKKIVFYK